MGTQPENNTPLEEQEIKGVTPKLVAWLFGSLGTILFSVVITYSSMSNKIENTTNAIQEIKADKKETDRQIKDFDIQLHTLELRVERIETDIQHFNKNK